MGYAVMKDQENTKISYHALLLLGAVLEIRREGRGRLDFLKQAGHVDGIHRLDLGLRHQNACPCAQYAPRTHKHFGVGEVREHDDAGEDHRDDLQSINNVLAGLTMSSWHKEQHHNKSKEMKN